MTDKTTPGSWKSAPVVQGTAFTPVFVGCEVRDKNGKLIVYLPAKRPGVTVSSSDAKTIEIANLIAAAPELLESLKEMLRVFDQGHDYSPALNAARAAIAKATGVHHD